MHKVQQNARSMPFNCIGPATSNKPNSSTAEILRVDARHVDALHLLGVVAFQLDNPRTGH